MYNTDEDSRTGILQKLFLISSRFQVERDRTRDSAVGAVHCSAELNNLDYWRMIVICELDSVYPYNKSYKYSK